MRRNWLAIGLVVAMAALMIGAVACGSSKKSTTNPTSTKSSGTAIAHDTPAPSGSAQSEVTVTLVEYNVVPNVTSVPAGTVTFNAKNIGGAEHELLVIKTDLQPDALPTKADGSVDEEAAGMTIVDHAHDIAAGSEKSLPLDLGPGDYVLICNIVQTTNNQTVSHYERGMHSAFTITE